MKGWQIPAIGLGRQRIKPSWVWDETTKLGRRLSFDCPSLSVNIVEEGGRRWIGLTEWNTCLVFQLELKGRVSTLEVFIQMADQFGLKLHPHPYCRPLQGYKQEFLRSMLEIGSTLPPELCREARKLYRRAVRTIRSQHVPDGRKRTVRKNREPRLAIAVV